jgi:hypothetical protein
MTMTIRKLMNWKIAVAAAGLMLAPAMLASPAAADTAPRAKAVHRAHAIRDAYASYGAPSYHCGIGLMNTPLPCEADH